MSRAVIIHHFNRAHARRVGQAQPTIGMIVVAGWFVLCIMVAAVGTYATADLPADRAQMAMAQSG